MIFQLRAKENGLSDGVMSRRCVQADLDTLARTMPLEAIGNSAGEVIGRPFELQILCVLVAHPVVSLDNRDRISLDNSGLLGFI